MTPMIRRLLAVTLAAAAGLAQAQAYPTKSITLVVPYAAGGLTDQLAREVGVYMSGVLKQPVVVDNRPGGAAQIAMNLIKQQPADGYMVLFGDVPSMATNVGLFKKLSYDPRKDLQPVTQLIVSPALVVVPNASPYQRFDDLVKGARAKPGGLTYASQGVGTGGHLFGTLLAKQIGAQMAHAAYRGSMPGLTDVMSGQVDFMYDAVPTSGAFVKGGKMRALAIGAAQRVPQFPDVPTLKELGYDSIVPTFWWGTAVKAGTSPEIVDRLQKVMNEAMHSPVIAAKFTEQGVIVQTSSPKAFTAYVDSEITRWTKVMHEAGMQAD
ncbi:tripartite-type tricarboxylate transporter receptor subunit TctC [Variovorax boronicumulans]|uniref:Bug family tripartite tricarboxylate transporter substrate binding protein n=1 Tax=Variovorax boronicumulans TaxID=436515 RepID=UPI0033975315